MAAVTLPLSCRISSSLNCKNASSRLTQSAIYDLGGGMMGDRIVELVLHRGEKLLCDRAFHIVVGAALGIDVRDFLVESSLAGSDVPDTLQLFLEIILAEKVLRLPQPCVIHHIAFDDELF